MPIDPPGFSYPKDFRSGFIALVGAPNAGKSTLLNRILGEKISITSRRPQTTRNRILGVRHRPATQIVFFDTPGVHKATNLLNERIVETALATASDADVILAVVDASRPDPDAEKLILNKIKTEKKPVVMVLNKIDLVHKTSLLELIDNWSQIYAFDDIVPVSATKGTQVDQLVALLEERMPIGPPFFPEDALTDQPERFLAAEMIREKIFRLTGEEIPYSTAVTIDEFKEEKKGSLIRIHASIHMERVSQKGIIIGKGGKMLKAIGEKSRLDMERFFGTRIFLKLFVRVQKNWRKDTRALKKFGY